MNIYTGANFDSFCDFQFCSVKHKDFFKSPLGVSFFAFPSCRHRFVLCTPCIQINTGATQHSVHINGMFRGTNNPLFAVQHSDTDSQQLSRISCLKSQQRFPPQKLKKLPSLPHWIMYTTDYRPIDLKNFPSSFPLNHVPMHYKRLGYRFKKYFDLFPVNHVRYKKTGL
jgi:hypothetical protein